MFLHDRPGYDKEEDLAKVGEDDRIDHIGLLSDKGETTGNIVSAKLSAIYVPEPEDEAIP